MHGLQEIIYANAAARSRAQAQSIKRHLQDAHRRIAVIRSWASDYPATLQPSNPATRLSGIPDRPRVIE